MKKEDHGANKVRIDYGWSITDIASWKWHHRVFTSLNTFCVCPWRQRTDTRRNQVPWNVVLIRILTHLILNGPLPLVTYTDIYDYLVNSHSVHPCEKLNAFKSLHAHRTVCSEGRLSTLGVQVWPNAVVLKCDVKPSQRSGILYRTWVAVIGNGSVVLATVNPTEV